MINASEQAAVHLQRGSQRYQQGDLAGARQAFQAALAVQPDLSPARFNLGVVCRELEENESARLYFEQLLDRGELLADAYNNLGILAVRREQDQQAQQYFRQAIQHRYEFPLAHFNLSTLLLRHRQWAEGWREYQWRWQTPSFTPLQCPQPLWDGQRLDGTLLVHTEQGIGDTFQFARFLPQIRRRCRRLILVRPDSLDCMFPASHWADEVIGAGEVPLDSFQAYLPLMSAAEALSVQPQDLPVLKNYLTPDQRRIELGPPHVDNAKLRVGITWRGSSTHSNDAYRSMSLTKFRPLFSLPQIAFYSLQIDPNEDEKRELSRHAALRDLSGTQRDFADTAAIVRQLDLIITVDTSILHLVGGMDLPGWGLLCRRSDWRWEGHDRTDTLWYPSLRLFRQRTHHDWDELMIRVASQLRAN
ncbi:MAG: tetratricopeptide repeat protein [Pirellulales bacterium]|nr:tetratricopeptide repeat protein [Pirellulales bacterium]